MILKGNMFDCPLVAAGSQDKSIGQGWFEQLGPQKTFICVPLVCEYIRRYSQLHFWGWMRSCVYFLDRGNGRKFCVRDTVTDYYRRTDAPGRRGSHCRMTITQHCTCHTVTIHCTAVRPSHAALSFSCLAHELFLAAALGRLLYRLRVCLAHRASDGNFFPGSHGPDPVLFFFCVVCFICRRKCEFKRQRLDSYTTIAYRHVWGGNVDVDMWRTPRGFLVVCSFPLSFLWPGLLTCFCFDLHLRGCTIRYASPPR